MDHSRLKEPTRIAVLQNVSHPRKMWDREFHTGFSRLRRSFMKQRNVIYFNLRKGNSVTEMVDGMRAKRLAKHTIENDQHLNFISF